MYMYTVKSKVYRFTLSRYISAYLLAHYGHQHILNDYNKTRFDITRINTIILLLFILCSVISMHQNL